MTHYRVGPMRKESQYVMDAMAEELHNVWARSSWEESSENVRNESRKEVKAAIKVFLREAGLADKLDRTRFEGNAVDACMMLHEIAQEEHDPPPEEDRPYREER